MPSCRAFSSSTSIALTGAGLAKRKPCISSAGKPQQNALVLGFDALDKHRQTKRAAKRHHRLDDHVAILGAAERGHEALVDLDLVEPQPLQVTEIGITGPEIIKRDAHAELVQILDALDYFVRAIDEHAFGDLQHQPPRRHKMNKA